MKQNKDGQASHHSQIFNFESILAATSNFSTENKLGEHGFGLVIIRLVLDASRGMIMELKT